MMTLMANGKCEKGSSLKTPKRLRSTALHPPFRLEAGTADAGLILVCRFYFIHFVFSVVAAILFDKFRYWRLAFERLGNVYGVR